jgi:vacuolar-type H+-ATPase subunit I/STV1
MHDHAIETRTALVLEAETEERRQEINDSQQAHDHERAAKDRDEQQRALDHQLEQQRQTRREQLAAEREKESQALAHLKGRQESEITNQRELLDLRMEEFRILQESGADLTAILVARERNPDKLIRLEQQSPTGAGFHIHEAV